MRMPRPRVWLAMAAALVVLAGLAGFLVAASGIIPLTASSGHWPVTRWILEFGKRRSIATHTLGMDLRFDEPWLVLKGAGHYESGCRPCHGSPELPAPRIAASMLPRPPYLPPRIARWSPEELFYVVKHGIKFTGMPAWPSLVRDDEVRAMVAFLLAMPELDAAAYERLVYGEAPAEPAVVPLEDMVDAEQPPDAVIASCARCHGVDGLGRGNAAYPKLAGQRPAYLYRSLRAYASGERNSGIMTPVAAGLSDRDWRLLADYYGELVVGAMGVSEGAAADVDTEDVPDVPMGGPEGLLQRAGGAEGASVPDPGEISLAERIERGRVIAHRGLPDRGVPSCADCHGPTLHPRNPVYPSLAGQYADYLVLQLELFEARIRGGTAYAPIMHHVVERLDLEQMRNVAAYYSSLGPEPTVGR